MQIRFALWRGDLDEAHELCARMPVGTTPLHEAYDQYAKAVTGALPLAEVIAHFRRLASRASTLRFASLSHQLGAELLADRAPDEAAEHLLGALDAGLLDLEWLERCPLLAPLSGRPELKLALAAVQARVVTVWEGNERSAAPL